MAEISDDVRDLIRQRVPTMDHIEVLMRIFEAGEAPVTAREIERSARLGPQTVSRCTHDLLEARLITADPATASFTFVPAASADRATVSELAGLYNQRPVTLVKLVYQQPPAPVKSFADAFRLREDDKS